MKGRFERPLRQRLTAASMPLPETPLVSVVMTCFNSARWLSSAIDSVLNQTWRHLELIVVDDGSTDAGPALLCKLSREESRIRLCYLHRNTGTYPAKNVGLSIAHGDVLTFMDSDDEIDPRRIEKQLQLLRKPGLVATTCNYIRRTSDGTVLLNGGLRERQALISVMFKRPVLAEIGWFDQVRTSADDEFFERIRHVYGRGAHENVAEPLYWALHYATSLSAQGSAPVLLSAENETGMLSPPRLTYVQSYREWYARLAKQRKRPYIPFDMGSERPFAVPEALRIAH